MSASDDRPVQGSGAGRAATLMHCAATLLASLYPLSLVLQANAGRFPIDSRAAVRLLLVTVALTALLLWCLRFLIAHLPTRAVWLTWLLLLSGGYGFVARALMADPASPPLALTYFLASVCIVTVALRPWRPSRRDPIPLLIAVVILLGTNAYRGASQVLALQPERWQQLADRLVASAPREAASVRVRPDIYYIVLDGFGRADTIEQYYDVDLGRFVDFLRSKGFYVPSRARSNYAQTFLSLASVLNLTYLDEASTTVGPNQEIRPVLDYLIQRNTLMGLAKQAGYHVIGVGSDWMGTQRLEAADLCLCQQYGLDGIERAVVANTPLAALPLDRWTFEAHRTKILASLAEIERPRSLRDPTFVFAHLLTPHPPFIFAPDGTPRRAPGRSFALEDGSHFPGSTQEYIAGYRDQVQFVTSRMTTLVESLLNRPGPPPVIVVHGDHGPGSMLQWDDAAATNLAERMNIFAAYRFPGNDTGFYDSMTPVNGARLLANEYFDTTLPPLPDVSWFSTWERPSEFIRVPDESGP